jgi:DNA polymerase
MPAGDSIRDQLEFFRDLGVTDLFLEAPTAAAALVPGSNRDLAALEKFLAGCPRCKLAKSRTNIVFGQGNPRADLMFVGEAPGRDEDEQGLAFVGRAGQLLTKIIEAIGRKREDVYIANCLKCRPPENRNPERDEVEACRPFLEEQIRLISPKVIVTLGTFAAQVVLGTDEPIGRLRGRWQTGHGVRVMPTFHPAFLLRSPDRKKDVWEDMKKVRDYLGAGRRT